jgi:predicted nucleotidyltransferase
MNIVENNIDRIKKLCDKYHVLKLYIFGSVLNSQFSNESDIDFLVTFANVELTEYADNYFDFKFSLEDLFQRQIDLLEEKAIKNPFFKQSVENSKKLIYG